MYSSKEIGRSRQTCRLCTSQFQKAARVCRLDILAKNTNTNVTHIQSSVPTTNFTIVLQLLSADTHIRQILIIEGSFLLRLQPSPCVQPSGRGSILYEHYLNTAATRFSFCYRVLCMHNVSIIKEYPLQKLTITHTLPPRRSSSLAILLFLLLPTSPSISFATIFSFLRWKSQRMKTHRLGYRFSIAFLIHTLGYGFHFWKSQTFGKSLKTFSSRIFS